MKILCLLACLRSLRGQQINWRGTKLRTYYNRNGPGTNREPSIKRTEITFLSGYHNNVLLIILVLFFSSDGFLSPHITVSYIINSLISTYGLSAVASSSVISYVQQTNFNVHICTSKGKFWISIWQLAIIMALVNHCMSPLCETITFLCVRLSRFSLPFPPSALRDRMKKRVV